MSKTIEELSGYQQLIVAATGCRPQDAEQVEETMRTEYRTLSHLSRAKFLREAQISWEAVQLLRAEGVFETPD